MKRNLLAFAISVLAFQGYAQNAVSGFVDNKKTANEGQKVVLSIVEFRSEGEARKFLATAPVQENGFFTFPASIFSSQDRIYEIHIEPRESAKKKLDTAISDFKSFILSNRDQLQFTEADDLSDSYATTNKADKEWQKLKEYQKRISAENQGQISDYITQTRNYTKDSLQILLVKLLSIKTLDEKKLLERDIKENPKFYLNLLEKLKKSDLEPASYAYLENRIATTHQDIIRQKYYFSLFLNFLGVVTILILLYVVLRLRKRSSETPVAALSKQEENVKELILQGKTNKEIATALFISISTVKTHTSNIYSKLNVSNRKDLIMKY